MHLILYILLTGAMVAGMQPTSGMVMNPLSVTPAAVQEPQYSQQVNRQYQQLLSVMTYRQQQANVAKPFNLTSNPLLFKMTKPRPGGSQPSEGSHLVRYLMTNYSRYVRPVIAANESVIIRARLFPIKLLNIYQKTEVLEIIARLQLNWKDKLLSWYEPEFDNLTSLILPGASLWVPDIQLANSVTSMYTQVRDPNFSLKVHSDGNVWFHPTGKFITRCELRLEFFPFDEQSCPIVLESSIFTVEHLNLTLRKDKAPVSLAMYIESGQWSLLHATASSELRWVTDSTAFTRVEFWLHVKRKTTYFKWNIFYPAVMLTGLQMMTFFFPIESQERVPQATSILLSVIVFQAMIADQLPNSSNSVPLLCIYVSMLTAVSVFVVAEAVFIACLIAQPTNRTPKWLQSLVKRLAGTSSVTAGRRHQSVEERRPLPLIVTSGPNEQTTSFVSTDEERPRLLTVPFSEYKNRLTQKKVSICSELDPTRRRSSSVKYYRANRPTSLYTNYSDQMNSFDWIFLAKRIDAFVFVICLILVSVIPIILFAIMPPEQEHD